MLVVMLALVRSTSLRALMFYLSRPVLRASSAPPKVRWDSLLAATGRVPCEYYMTLEGVRSPSVLRTVARCCSADRSATIFGAERVRMRLGSWRRGRTISRSCDTPPRGRCLRVRFSVQCSECTPTYQLVAAVTRAGGRGIGCITAEGTRAQRRLQR